MKATINQSWWYQMRAGDEITRLLTLHGAIQKWCTLADEEFRLRWQGKEEELDPRAAWGYDPRAEDASVVGETQPALYACLAVATMASVEGFVADICSSLAVKVRKKAQYKDKVEALKGALQIQCSRLPGFCAAEQARIMGNCFKHEFGKANAAYAKKFALPVGAAIKYETIDWVGMIENTRRFLLSLASKVPSKEINFRDMAQAAKRLPGIAKPGRQ